MLNIIIFMCGIKFLDVMRKTFQILSQKCTFGMAIASALFAWTRYSVIINNAASFGLSFLNSSLQAHWLIKQNIKVKLLYLYCIIQVRNRYSPLAIRWYVDSDFTSTIALHYIFVFSVDWMKIFEIKLCEVFSR